MSEAPQIIDQKGKSAAPIYCSWCGKRDHEVKHLIAGPCVFICNECVELCVDILAEKGIAITPMIGASA